MLVVVAHVLALDVTSFELLLGQLGAAYSHFLGKGDPLPVAPEYRPGCSPTHTQRFALLR